MKPANLDARCVTYLTDAIWELARVQPFYGHILAGLDRMITSQVPTAAVGPGADGGVVLSVNPSFFAAKLRGPKLRVAVLEHEVLHLAFGHLRLDHRRMPHARRRNIAADLVVNQYVTHPLPKSAVTLKCFPGFPRDLTCEGYYDLLSAMSDDALGTAVPDDPQGHERWEEGDATVNGRLRDEVDAICEEARRRSALDGSHGSLPEGVWERIAAPPARVRVDPLWKRMLRTFCMQNLRTGIRQTTQRESRRYGADRIHWSGRIVPGLRRARRPSLVVAIDTSGSISGSCLEAFFDQVARIASTGAEVHVVECDLQVQRSYPWKGTTPAEVKGRGGTAFDPVLTWLWQARKTMPIGGCVYLTDGYADVPQVRPPCPLLWVIAPGGTAQRTAFGRAVAMPEETGNLSK